MMFFEYLKEFLYTELNKRINIITKSNYKILDKTIHYTEEEIEFELEIKNL
jgi:hypothetical protein